MLPVEHLQRGSHAVDGLADDVLLLDQGRRQPVDRLHRGDDVVLLLVEPTDHPVEVAQQVARGVLTTVHHVVQLVADRLELTDSAAGQQHRQGAEDLLDLRVPAGAGERDEVTAGQPLGALRARGRLDQGDVLLPQQAGLAYVDLDVLRQLDVLAHEELDPGVPADPLDLGDVSDGHVVGEDGRAGHHVERVGEVGLDLVGVVGARPCSPAGAGRRRRRTCSRTRAGR